MEKNIELNIQVQNYAHTDILRSIPTTLTTD